MQTTSSINLLAHCFGTLLQSGDEILLSVLEHHSNLVPWQTLAKQKGIILRYLFITPAGRLDLMVEFLAYAAMSTGCAHPLLERNGRCD